MKRANQGHVLAFIAACVLLTVARGSFTNFVKPSMQWFLVVAGVALGAVAVAAMRGSGRAPRDVADDRSGEGRTGEGSAPQLRGSTVQPSAAAHEHGHDHSRAPAVGWLAVVPFLVMGLLAPAPLGAYSASRAVDAKAKAPVVRDTLTLPPTGDVVLTLGDFTAHSLNTDKPLLGRTARLTGFVTEVSPTATGATWYLTRMAMGCCAADAYPIFIDPGPVERPGPSGSWVTVVAQWDPEPGPDGKPVLPAKLITSQVLPATSPVNVYDAPTP